MLITGGTGFIGRNLVEYFIEKGFQVSTLSSRKLSQNQAQVMHYCCDILDHNKLVSIMKSIDVLIHCAAIYQIGYYDNKHMAAVNIGGTRNVLEAAKQTNIKNIIYLSTTAVHGETLGELGDESTLHNGKFRSYYEQTKHIAHAIALDYVEQGLPLNIISPGGIYGCYDQGPIYQAISDLVKGKLPVIIDTFSTFNLSHVDDVCQAVDLVLKSEGVGEEYIVAQTVLSFEEIINKAADHFKLGRPKKVKPSRLWLLATLFSLLSKVMKKTFPLNSEVLQIMDGSSYTYKSDKIINRLGWETKSFDDQFSAYLSQIFSNDK